MGCGGAAVAAGSSAASTTVRRMKAEDRVRRSNHRMKRGTPATTDSAAAARWTRASGEAEGYGPYKPVPPPKPSQQQQQQPPQDRTECVPTPPPYRMPPLPVQPQQFQQHAASLPEGAGRGSGGVEAALPGAPDASPPLHTHSSKFPIEREVIVSSAEKASDTFKAKIPLIQDYGRRVIGSGVGNVGGGGMARSIVLGGGGPVAVAPDAPIKQVAWTEEGAGKAGRKVTSHHHHHHHHIMSPANSVHVGVRGQQQQFQNQDGVHNRQGRDDMPPHSYNGHLTGAVPRREWDHGPIKGEVMVPHGMQHAYPHSNHNASREDPGNTRPQPSLMPNQGPYSSTPCNTETARYVQGQEEDTKAGYSVNSGARQQDTGDNSATQAHVENSQARMDFDVEGNADRDCDKVGGRLSNQASNKAFPSRTYHQIKDMISSRFGGSNKPKDGQLQTGGDVENGLNRREGREREGVSNQGLNNSGCRPPTNISEVSRPTPTRMSAIQHSSRKSNNLGDREDAHHRAEANQRDHYQTQSGKNEFDHRVEAIPAMVSAMQSNKDGTGDQHMNRGEGGQSMQMFQQGMAPDADYGMSGGAIRKNGRREEMGSREMLDHGYASPQKGMIGRQSQHTHSPQSKKKEDEEHTMQSTQISQIEYSLGSIQLGEPAYYSTPVGGEQGKQNNSNFHGMYSPTGDSTHNTNILMQHLRQQGQGNTPTNSHNYSVQSINHGCVNLKSKDPISNKATADDHDKGLEQQRQLGGIRTHANEESSKSGNKDMRRGHNPMLEEGDGRGDGPPRNRQGGEERGNERLKGGDTQSCFIYQESIAGVEGGSAGGSVGGGSSDYEKATHRSGRSTSTDSGRGTAGHGMTGSRKGSSHNTEGSEIQRDRMGGQSPEEVENTGPDTSTESDFAHPGSRHALYGLNGLNPGNDSEWVDVVESELRQILDPKLHVGVGTAMSPGIANSTVSESMSMTPPLPPLSPGGSPPASPTLSPKDRGKNYKLSASMPYINKQGQIDQKLQSSNHPHIQSHGTQGSHHLMNPSKGGNSSRLQQALSHSGIISVSSKGQQHGRQQRSGIRMTPSGPEGGVNGARGGGWVGSGRASKGSSGDRSRAAMRKEQQMHGMSQNNVKAMLSNSVPLASFGAMQNFDNGDMTSTTTGLDLDSMLDGQTENTSDEDMSATIDTTDAQAIRRQLEGLENMYSEVLKLLGVKKHNSRYQPSDPRINKRRMYGSLSSIPSSVSSRPVRDKRRQDERKKVKDIKGINKRFQRLESHVVTLARSVAHLSSEMRTQHLMMQEMETIRGEIAQLRAQPVRSQSVPRLAAKSPLEKDSFCNNVPALTNPERVKKLTRFFGDEPPLLRIFLKKLGYEKYAGAFEHERIGLVELPYLTEERLQKMGIPMGPRLRIIQEAQISFCQENMNVYVV